MMCIIGILFMCCLSVYFDGHLMKGSFRVLGISFICLFGHSILDMVTVACYCVTRGCVFLKGVGAAYSFTILEVDI